MEEFTKDQADKIGKERIKKLIDDLKINNDEALILNRFLVDAKAYKNYSPNYYDIRLFCDAKNLDFETINKLYNKWLDKQAEDLGKRKLKGILLHSRYKNTIQTYINQIDFIDDLEHLYNIILCSAIDIQERKIKNKYYDFIFDDEYLLKEPTFKEMRAIQKDKQEIIFRNLLIVGKADNKGQETSLSIADINQIKQSAQIVSDGAKQKLVIVYDF